MLYHFKLYCYKFIMKKCNPQANYKKYQYNIHKKWEENQNVPLHKRSTKHEKSNRSIQRPKGNLMNIKQTNNKMAELVFPYS